MKENVLDVLMYLFENYMDEDEQANPDRDTLKTELQEAGFGHGEVDKALNWLEGLSELKTQAEVVDRPHSKSMRLFSAFEMKKMDSECRGFLTFLENLGVLNAFTREVVIDRVMALETADISVDQLKWVVMMVLFNQPGEEAALAWIEDLVFREDVGLLH